MPPTLFLTLFLIKEKNSINVNSLVYMGTSNLIKSLSALKRSVNMPIWRLLCDHAPLRWLKFPIVNRFDLYVNSSSSVQGEIILALHVCYINTTKTSWRSVQKGKITQTSQMLERGEAEICDMRRLFTLEKTTASTVFQKVRLFCACQMLGCV